MHGLFELTAASLASLITVSHASPLIASPGTVSDLVITKDNTLNGTSADNGGTSHGTLASTNPLTISLVNNYEGTTQINVYVSGKDDNDDVVLLSPSGEWYYPNADGSTISVEITADIANPIGAYGETVNFTLPDYISSGRIYVSVGELTFFTLLNDLGVTSLVEPSFTNAADKSADIKWGFVEFTNNSGGIYANLSFVDFVGLVLGMSLTLADNTVQVVKGLKANSVANVCNAMIDQAAEDGLPWDDMCVTDASGNPLRTLSPNQYMTINPDAMTDFYTDYVDEVWTKYTSQNLTIDTQGSAGEVGCRVSESTGNLTCAGDNRPYAKPTTLDIFGCNTGPFATQDGDNEVHLAVVARLCAAFVRGTLLLDGGDVQPSLSDEYYYTTSPSCEYCRIVHEYEEDNLGYSFAYDDVNPSGQNAAGVVSGADPTLLKITVGGYS